MSLIKEPISKVHLHARVKRLTEKGEKIVELATAKGAFRDAVAALNACSQLCELDAQLRMNPTRRKASNLGAAAPRTTTPAAPPKDPSPEEQVDFDTALAQHVATITKGFQKEEVDALIERLRAIAQKTPTSSNSGHRPN